MSKTGGQVPEVHVPNGPPAVAEGIIKHLRILRRDKVGAGYSHGEK
jgi:hypothetical protein